MGRFSYFLNIPGWRITPPFCVIEKAVINPIKRNLFSNSKQMECIGMNYNLNAVNIGCPLVKRVYQFNSVFQRFALMGTTSQNTRPTCWNCSKNIKTSTLFCEFCSSLQPVDNTQDFFQILGVKRSYNIKSVELKDLRQKFRNLQTLLHPDKFTSNSKKEQEISEEFSSVVNKAFSTLSNPLERGLYLLSLHGVSIGEGNTDVDKVFLMEIMERNEEIENETDPQKLKELNLANKEQLQLLTKKITEAFDSNDLELAKKFLTEMKYYNTIDTKIKDIKQKFNIPD